MSMKWENISITGKSNQNKDFPKCFAKKEKIILRNISGYINRNSLVALMGPSGAGKSTLLKCLCNGQRNTGFKGSIFVESVNNGRQSKACFITQSESDHLLDRLTVKESLIYSSKLKNLTNDNRYDHNFIANNLIHRLNLKVCERNKVTDCSGGQRKRLAIGLELASSIKPDILMLDEPTSGLDSSNGFEVINLLKDLSRSENMSIIVTIHQPSYKIFVFFDLIYALTNLGNAFYFGKPEEVKDWFLKFKIPIETMHNPADILIDWASQDRPHIEKTVIKNLRWYWTRIVSYFRRTEAEESQGLVVQIENSCEIHGNEIGFEVQIVEDMKESTKEALKLRKSSFDSNCVNLKEKVNGLCCSEMGFSFSATYHLFCRTMKNSVLRDQKFLIIRLLLHAITAGVLIALYKHNLGQEDGCIPENQSTLLNVTKHELKQRVETLVEQNTKFQFFSTLFIMFAALMPTVLTFPHEVKIFINEHRNGWYSSLTYFLAKTIAEIPIQLLLSYFYVWLLYSMTSQIGMDYWYYGLPGLWTVRFGYFVLFTQLTAFISQGIAFFIGIFFVNNFNITIFVSTTLLLLLFVFSGFFIKISQMSEIAKCFTFLSVVRFSFEGLMIILYGLDRCERKINFKNSLAIAPNQTLISSVLLEYDLKDSDLWKQDCAILILNLFLWRVLAYIALRTRVDHRISGILRKMFSPLQHCQRYSDLRDIVPICKVQSPVDLSDVPEFSGQANCPV